MGPSPPSVLAALLSASAESEPDAWAAFVEAYSDLLLHVAHSLGGGHDAVMDRYAYVLEQLRRDGARRLRGYADAARGKFTTWLVVVARRLCLDHYRGRYGRAHGDDAATERRATRRALADLVVAQLEATTAPADPDAPADDALAEAETHAAVRTALAALDPAERLLLRLRFENELSVPEIARLMGEPSPFVVYRRLEKLLTRLRGELRAVGIDGAG